MKKLLVWFMGILIIFLPLFSAAEAKIKNWENVAVSNLDFRWGTQSDIAYGDGRYGILFYDARETTNVQLYLSLLKKSGEKIGNDIRITNSTADSMDPNIVWNGKDFGIFYRESWIIYYVRVSNNGQIITGPISIDIGVHPSVVWNEKTKEYGLTWWGGVEGTPEGTVFVRLDRNGNKLSPIIGLNSVVDGGYYRPRIATNGNNYGITWYGRRDCGSDGCPEVIFTVVNANGEKIVSDRALTHSGTEGPWSIAWNGFEYAMVTQGSSGISLLRVDETGDVISFSPLSEFLTDRHTRYLEIIWDKNHYVLSFVDCLTCNTSPDANIYITKYDRYGNSLSDFIRISKSAKNDYFPSKAILAASSVAIVWVGDYEETSQNISFAQENNF